MITNEKLRKSLESTWGKPKETDNKFELIDYYFRKLQPKEELQIISDRTINDIDFNNIFSFVDRTHSRIGQQYLFKKLLTIEKSPDFAEQEDLCQTFASDCKTRISVQTHLSKLNDENSYHVARLFLDEFIEPPKNFPVLKILTVLSIATLIASLFITKLFLLLILLYCINMILHYGNKKHIYMYSDSIPQLGLMCKCFRDLLKFKLPVKTEEKSVASLKSIDQLKNLMKIFTLEAKSHELVGGTIHLLSEYVKIQFLLEPIIVFHVLKRLREKRDDIQNLFEYIGKIDSAISIASLRQGSILYCRPIIASGDLQFHNIYHPLIDDCVQNDLQLNHKSILLTGSNMSGKTTFIRSITINILLAQTINTCFASSFQLPPIRLFSAIRISDDVLNGISYYFEEVLTIREMVVESQSGIKSLFLLDEIFKGTNTIERIAAGKSVLSHLSRNGNIVFVSTHDIELTDLLRDEYELYHFTEDIKDDKVHFDYKLKPGELKTRNAIRILEISGYPKELVEEAKAISIKIVKNIQREEEVKDVREEMESGNLQQY